MKQPTVSTYTVLGLLAVRSWTGYELTQHLRRSLRFVWSSSEAHLYREQKTLLDLGWAVVDRERVGKRRRNRYTITVEGRQALEDWLRTEPQEPHFEIEGIVRMFYGDQGTVDDLVRSVEMTALMARSMLDSLAGFAKEYLEDGGPVWMLEHDVGGSDEARIEFHGRPQFPERLHVVALVIETTSRLLAQLETSMVEVAAEVREWASTTDSTITPATRRRLEAIAEREIRP